MTRVDRKLVAAVACRNQGTRLYAKPLQNLDIENGVTILDNVVACLKSVPVIDEICLGIAASEENIAFTKFADQNGLPHITGDEQDVLGRLVACGEKAGATDILRVTSESPFPSFDLMEAGWDAHVESDADATFMDHVVDGCGFEIISLQALQLSHSEGEDRHRSELCTLYLRENRDRFRIENFNAPEELHRMDLRLTVDYPEDLVLCRAVYENLKGAAPNIAPRDIVDFLDRNPDLVNLTYKFTEAGYETMYL